MRRTTQQNRALYKYFDNLANALNDAGLEVKHVLQSGLYNAIHGFIIELRELGGEYADEYVWIADRLESIIETNAARMDIPWNKDLVKNLIWKPVEKITLNKDSTADMDTIDINPIYEIINRHFSEVHKLYVPFPSEEEL